MKQTLEYSKENKLDDINKTNKKHKRQRNKVSFGTSCTLVPTSSHPNLSSNIGSYTFTEKHDYYKVSEDLPPSSPPQIDDYGNDEYLNVNDSTSDEMLYKEFDVVEKEEIVDTDTIESATNCIIEYMAITCRNAKQTIESIKKYLMEGILGSYDDRVVTRVVEGILESERFFGKLKRSKLDANNKKVPDLYYYIPQNDSNMSRMLMYAPHAKRVRQCTLIDAQYYFKPIAK
ncbi:hypothetical protein BB559_000536 [Furculomyces boomerangus]|uniref:Uncharacterized protein n=1 Tax=Furculomyces boomerangus TaxID=61424 RepID=A0A2T9Z4X5_9FUNG|nr:hypothetical protein BB559_000536 [Furculomyces boomerangus]